MGLNFRACYCGLFLEYILQNVHVRMISYITSSVCVCAKDLELTTHEERSLKFFTYDISLYDFFHFYQLIYKIYFYVSLPLIILSFSFLLVYFFQSLYNTSIKLYIF